MAKLSIDFCQRIATARRERSMTQSAVASLAGCKQSAISMFEAGDTTKLSAETVAKISKILGVSLEEPKELSSQTPTGPVAARGYCPSCHCPSNVPYVVENRLFFRPSREIASAAGRTRCTQCGEVLEMHCPVCGAPLNDGACCATCGSAYVTPTLPPGTDFAAYAIARRAEITSLRSLS